MQKEAGFFLRFFSGNRAPVGNSMAASAAVAVAWLSRVRVSELFRNPPGDDPQQRCAATSSLALL